jgi:hypothetical protein
LSPLPQAGSSASASPGPSEIKITPWTKPQRVRIRESFGAERQAQQTQQISAFIEHALQITWLRNLNAPIASQKTIIKQLTRIEEAARELLDSLSRVMQGDALLHLEAAAHLLEQSKTGTPPTRRKAQLKDRLQKWAAESSGARVGARAQMRLRLEADTNALQLQARYAQRELKASRGDRAKDRRASLLVSFLYQEWCLIFGVEPKTSRDGEFHHVAVAVGEALGLEIGPKVLANKRFRTYWIHLIP